MESDSDSDINVFGDSSEEEISATIRASSERIPTNVVNDAAVRFVCVWHSKQRYLELFSPTSTRVSRQEIGSHPLLQQTVAAFNPANEEK
uniref:Uncharacterized protein n=1 Tax=Ditylenchus dipsaci TaxID=166011 RepID=A0A915DI91_9BILA